MGDIFGHRFALVRGEGTTAPRFVATTPCLLCADTKGAFTGTVHDQAGLLKSAAKETPFPGETNELHLGKDFALDDILAHASHGLVSNQMEDDTALEVIDRLPDALDKALGAKPPTL